MQTLTIRHLSKPSSNHRCQQRIERAETSCGNSLYWALVRECNPRTNDVCPPTHRIRSLFPPRCTGTIASCWPSITERCQGGRHGTLGSVTCPSGTARVPHEPWCVCSHNCLSSALCKLSDGESLTNLSVTNSLEPLFPLP